MAALKKGLQRREYFSWILKDVVTHSDNIVECLFYVGSMTGAGCEEGGKRPILCGYRSQELALVAAVGSDLGGGRQCRAQMSAAREAIVCPVQHRPVVPRGTDPKSSLIRLPPCRGQRRTMSAPTIARRILRFPLYPEQLGKEEKRGGKTG